MSTVRIKQLGTKTIEKSQIGSPQPHGSALGKGRSYDFLYKSQHRKDKIIVLICSKQCTGSYSRGMEQRLRRKCSTCRLLQLKRPICSASTQPARAQKPTGASAAHLLGLLPPIWLLPARPLLGGNFSGSLAPILLFLSFEDNNFLSIEM